MILQSTLFSMLGVVCSCVDNKSVVSAALVVSPTVAVTQCSSFFLLLDVDNIGLMASEPFFTESI